MKLELQPRTFIDVTTLASLAETAAVSIEYLNGAKPGEKVFLTLSATAPTSTEDAQAILVCDHDSFKSVRTVQGVAGSKIYAWFETTSNSPMNLLVG